MRSIAVFVATLGILWATSAHAQSMSPDCAALARQALPGATDVVAENMAAASFPLPMDDHGMGSPGMRITGAQPLQPNPAFCRVRAVLRPTAQSAIRMELWLPAQGWNGKFIGVGNFGWGGSLPYNNMLAGLERGYAVAGNDTGHDSAGPDGEGGRFLLGKPEVLTDYAWRANHLMTVAAKDLITKAFGNGPKRSYWIGCSLGGLQGLIEARRFPEDYDGVVAGAPPNPLTAFNAAQLWPNWLIAQDPRRALTPAKLAVLHDAVIKACAKEAGKLYGYVEDPAHCAFNPGSLECRKSDPPKCLTARQVAFVRLVYRGPVTGRGAGNVIFPGPAKGSELEWAPFINGREFLNAADLFRYAAFQRPSWQARTINWDRDVPIAMLRLQAQLHVDEDFRAFAARGGRLLLYVGGNDYHNPTELVDYLHRIHAKLGEKADHYARLFVIPGMGHCGGSQGCDAWDKVEAIDAWVDRKAGRTPRDIAKVDRDTGVVLRRQPLCYAPDVAVYRGAGDLASSASYECKPTDN